jgi:hypothetical protein
MGAHSVMTYDTVDKIAAMQQEDSHLKDHAHQAWLVGHTLAIY